MSLTVEDLVIEIDGRRVVDGVSFQVPDGARLGVIGESGSGKSSPRSPSSGSCRTGRQRTGASGGTTPS